MGRVALWNTHPGCEFVRCEVPYKYGDSTGFGNYICGFCNSVSASWIKEWGFHRDFIGIWVGDIWESKSVLSETSSQLA